ncbi:MAG: hypothetical protein ACE5F1_14905, partial [Planctomycetota bacterium]
MPPVPLSLIAPLLLAALPSVAAQGQERKLYQGKPLGHWIRQLKIGKWFEREQALKAIREAGPDARGHVTDLIRAVNKPRLRLLAIEALGAIGPLAKKAVSKVREHRRSGNPALRDAAMRALDRLGADVIRLLIADLGTRKFSGDAIQRLARFGERAKPAVRKLARIITYKPRLSMVGVRDKRAIDQYRRERARADRNRMLALNAIVAIGPEAARDALPAVAQAMKHSDPKIAELAIRVLGIFGEDAIPGYSLAFRDKTHPHRRMFIEAWQAFGPASRRVLPLLQKIAMSRSSMKRQASDAILAIRTATEQLSRVGDNDPDLRLEAALALCSYGRSAMEGIVQGLRDPVAENRRALLERILELGKLLAPGRAGGRSASWPPMPRQRMANSPSIS